MEYLKALLTYSIITIVFNIPIFVKWIKNKDSYHLNLLKRNAKFHIAIIFGRLLSTKVLDLFLQMDVQVFNMSQELAVAGGINIMYAFINLFI